ncbi:MAG TPA: hypothetical protein VN943_06245 [Candidatus Acidoferrum sp.]|nr:hypothetical protein [Candidatus Acidoferrum sp.]
MRDQKYLLGSIVNISTLIIGLVLGFIFGSMRTVIVKAQSTPQVEEISPNITSGSAAFGTLLAGRLATDEISVKGFDPIKFDENLLNLLGSKTLLFNRAELQSVADRSKSEKILTMKLPQATPPSAEKKP